MAEVEKNQSGLAARSMMYALLACHQMANYITRLAVPFIVPFIVHEFGFSESHRAMLLNCFTPGAPKCPPAVKSLFSSHRNCLTN